MKLKLRRNKGESRKAKTEKEEEEKKMNKWTGWGFHVCSLSSRLFLLWRIDMNMDFFFFFFVYLLSTLGRTGMRCICKSLEAGPDPLNAKPKRLIQIFIKS